MKRPTLATAIVAAVLCSGPGMLLAQQQSPKQSGPPQNAQDVPHQQPGTDNPDLAAGQHPSQGTGTTTGTGTTSKSRHSKKKTRGKTSTSTQTQTSSR